MNQKQMFLNCQIKQSTGDERIVSGYTSTWGLDSGRDKMVYGSFNESIKQRFKNQKDNGQAPKIKVLYQHDPKLPVGVPTVLKEDPKGLYFEARISKTKLGDEVLEMVKDGTISSMSIGFVVLKDEYDSKQDIRYIKEVKLVEFSFVTFPMNEEAMITGWKNSMEQLYSIETEIDKRVKEAVEKELTERKDLWQTGEPVKPAEDGHTLTLNGTVGVKGTVGLSTGDTSELVSALVKSFPDLPGSVETKMDCPTCSQDLGPVCPTCGQLIECPCCGQDLPGVEDPGMSEDDMYMSVDAEHYAEVSIKNTIMDNENLIKEAILSELKTLGLDKYNEEEYIEKVGRAISRTNEQMLRDIVQALAPLKALLDSLETETSPPSPEEAATQPVAVEEVTQPVTPDASTPPAIEVSPEPPPYTGEELLQDLQNVDWSALLASTNEPNNLGETNG